MYFVEKTFGMLVYHQINYVVVFVLINVICIIYTPE